MPIVAYAVYEYFVNDIPVEETIRKHRDIYDFCKSVNISKNYDLYSYEVINKNLIKVQVQKHTRYYISNKGCTLIKEDFNSGRKYKLTKGYNLTKFNDFKYYNDFNKYNINYNYYIKESYKIINKVKKDTNQLKLF
jgi:hypothetical protein